MKEQPIAIRQATAPQEIAAIRALFQEYADGLGVDLCFQSFAAELAGLPGAYGPPGGRLLLAHAGGGPAGCVALRAIADGVCEMKRLFVRPAFRGSGLGRALAERVIQEARASGYRKMRLDTLRSLQPAISLYETLGFVRCAPYYDTPLADTVFMELQL